MLTREGHPQALVDGGDCVGGLEPGAEAVVSISQPQTDLAGEAGISDDIQFTADDECTFGPTVEESAKAREVTHYQCVGEGSTRVFYIWVKGQHAWTMPARVVLPAQLGRLIQDEGEDGRNEENGLDEDAADREVVEIIWAYNVETMKHEWVRWSDTVARPRFLGRVAHGMPDAEGLWL